MPFLFRDWIVRDLQNWWSFLYMFFVFYLQMSIQWKTFSYRFRSVQLHQTAMDSYSIGAFVQTLISANLLAVRLAAKSLEIPDDESTLVVIIVWAILKTSILQRPLHLIFRTNNHKECLPELLIDENFTPATTLNLLMTEVDVALMGLSQTNSIKFVNILASIKPKSRGWVCS